MRTWMPSTPRPSSCSTRPCVASPSPSVAGLCLPLLTKPGPSGSAAACRDGGRANSVRNSFLSAAISRTTDDWAMRPSRWSMISRARFLRRSIHQRAYRQLQRTRRVFAREYSQRFRGVLVPGGTIKSLPEVCPTKFPRLDPGEPGKLAPR